MNWRNLIVKNWSILNNLHINHRFEYKWPEDKAVPEDKELLKEALLSCGNFTYSIKQDYNKDYTLKDVGFEKIIEYLRDYDNETKNQLLKAAIRHEHQYQDVRNYLLDEFKNLPDKQKLYQDIFEHKYDYDNLEDIVSEHQKHTHNK